MKIKYIMKIIITISISLLVFAFSNSKTNPQIVKTIDTFGDTTKIEIWKTLQIQNIGDLSYPSKRLEIQNSNLKALNDSIKTILVIPVMSSKLTLQQVGLNTGQNFSYCRVLVEEIKGNNGDFLPSNIKLNSLTNEEQNLVKENYKLSIINSFRSLGIEIKKWYPVELKEINGAFCIILKYERESSVSKSDVIVNLYCFPKNNKEIDLTLSCRIDEKSSWESDFNKISNSFKLK
jgi:hypothetical protein